jgi:hypothetical protein
MKTHSLLSVFGVFLLNSFMLNAQIIFERNYSNSVYFTKLSDTEEKLFLMDVPFSECRIYNLDHSLYKTIKVKLDPNHYLYDISYITRKLFNSDDSIEFLYMAYEYIDDTVPYYQYMVGVVNENGTDLLKVPEGTYYEVIEVAGNKKLLIWLYDNSTWPYFRGTNIYMLESGNTKNISLKSSVPYDPAYPNPTSDQIVIPYDLQGKTNRAYIQITSSNGKVIGNYTVDNIFRELLLDVSEFIPGIYQYTITTEKSELLHSQSFSVVR